MPWQDSRQVSNQTRKLSFKPYNLGFNKLKFIILKIPYNFKSNTVILEILKGYKLNFIILNVRN